MRLPRPRRPGCGSGGAGSAAWRTPFRCGRISSLHEATPSRLTKKVLLATDEFRVRWIDCGLRAEYPCQRQLEPREQRCRQDVARFLRELSGARERVGI